MGRRVGERSKGGIQESKISIAVYYLLGRNRCARSREGPRRRQHGYGESSEPASDGARRHPISFWGCSFGRDKQDGHGRSCSFKSRSLRQAPLHTSAGQECKETNTRNPDKTQANSGWVGFRSHS